MSPRQPQDFSVYDNVKVDIEVDGKPLVQYKSPDPAEADRPERRIRYIEAEDGVKFAISTTLPSGFEWGQATCVKRFVTCDGRRLPARRTHKTSSHYYHRQTSFRYACPTTGKCKKADLHFRELNMEEVSGPGIDVDSLKKVGKIVIELQRRTYKEITPEPLKHDHKPFVSYASEKALLACDVPSTVSVDYVNERASTYEMQTVKSEEIAGERGIIYEFRYRSREFIRSMEDNYHETICPPVPPYVEKLAPAASAPAPSAAPKTRSTIWRTVRRAFCSAPKPEADNGLPPAYSEKGM